jgi:pimeloyl-ACP methyl ester carboxylesterase
MFEAVESRELLELDIPGAPVMGTFHKPRDPMNGLPAVESAQDRIGIVFFNSLFLPRTATGDSSVYWAESFARAGYPSFRLDLPGLGDSYAPLNTQLLDFINAGGYESAGASMIELLVARFQLPGVVIVGHCAGSVSALYAAGASRHCRGLILMDPYFFLPPQMKKSKLWKRVVRWGARSKFGGALSRIYDRLKELNLSVHGNALPANANFALLRRWKEVTKRGVPVLLFKAPGRRSQGAKPRVGEFDYLKYITQVADQRSEVVLKLVEGTDHSFATRVGRSTVREHVERWLSAHFPLARPESGMAPLDVTADNEGAKVAEEKHAPCL